MSNETASDRIIRIREVSRLVGLSRPSIYRMMREGDFPPAIRLGVNSVGWRASAVEAWINSRPQAA